MPDDSCISHLPSVVDEIQSSFDYKPTTDVRAISLDIAKAFNKVLHQGLLKSYGVEGNLFKLLEN